MAVLDPTQTTLICPNNDLESVTIIEIAKTRLPDLDLRTSKQGWGASLDREPELLSDLRENVVIVEMPGSDAERRIRMSGHELTIIDHHVYGDLDRIHEKSSLERFAELFGLELSPFEKDVALNDIGYIYLFMRECVPYERILEVRRRDLEAQGLTAEDVENSNADYDRSHLDFPRFSLARTTQRNTSAVSDRHCIPSRDEYEWFLKDNATKDEDQRSIAIRNLLILVEENGEPIELRLSGDRWLIKQFLCFVRQLGGSIKFWHNYPVDSPEGPCSRSFYAGLSNCQPGTPIEIDLIDRLFRLLLADEKFLDKYATMFFYPFWSETPSDDTGSIEKCWEKRPFNPADEKNRQEFLYFHRYIRDFLYDTRDSSTSSIEASVLYYEYKLDASQENSFELIYLDNQKRRRQLKFNVYHIGLHRYYHGINILVIGVKAEVDKYNRKEPTLSDLEMICRKCLFLEQVMAFNQLGRILYASYENQLREGKIAIETTLMDTTWRTGPSPPGPLRRHKDSFEQETFEPVVIDGVHKLVGTMCKSYRGTLDDRMFVHSFLSFSPYCQFDVLDQQQRERRMGLFSRLLFVDGYSHKSDPPYVYDKQFVTDLMEDLLYRRFDHYQTLYGFSRFSAIFSGVGDFFTKEVFGHFNSIYYQMVLLALYYRTVLVEFSREVSCHTEGVTEEGTDRAKDLARHHFSKLRREFMTFSNRFWFEEITHQDQGIELFEIQKRVMQLSEMYKRVRADIERTDEYLETQAINELTRKMGKLTWLGAILAIVMISLTFTTLPYFNVQPRFWQTRLDMLVMSIILALILFVPTYLYISGLRMLRIPGILWAMTKRRKNRRIQREAQAK